jgi:hypothetical protein
VAEAEVVLASSVDVVETMMVIGDVVVGSSLLVVLETIAEVVEVVDAARSVDVEPTAVVDEEEDVAGAAAVETVVVVLLCVVVRVLVDLFTVAVAVNASLVKVVVVAELVGAGWSVVEAFDVVNGFVVEVVSFFVADVVSFFVVEVLSFFVVVVFFFNVVQVVLL